MEINTSIYLIIDGQGNKYHHVAPSDEVEVTSVCKTKSHPVVFCGEIKHLSEWCMEHGFEFKVTTVTHDFNVLWNSIR